MKRRLLGGLFWQAGTTLLARGTRYAAVLVLGRLLSPADFGAFASLYVLVEGLFLLSGMGLGEALVVRRERVEEAADVTFLLAAALGVAAFGAAWVVAPAVEAFFGLAGATPLFRAMSAVLLLHGLRVVPLRLLERRFAFRSKMLPTVLGALAYLGVSVGMAARGHDVWSFVAALLAAGAVETGLLWAAAGWRPRARWSGDIAREAVAFGLPVVAGGAGLYLFGTIDRVALARWGGAEMLGAYAFAFSLAALPATLGASIAGTVLLPSYGELAADPARRLALHERAVGLTAGAGVLFALLMLVLGGDALRAVYGTKWEAAVPVLQVLAAGSVFRTTAALAGDLLVGIGRPRAFQAMNALQLVVAAAGIPIGLARAGAAGVAVAVSVASVVALAFGWAAAGAAQGVPAVRFVRSFANPVRAGAAAAVALALVRLAAPDPAGAGAIVLAAAAATATFALVWWKLDASLRADVAAWRAGRLT